MISVIIPFYNAKEYIKETIDSVRAQTFEDWELILVDDCSTDDTAELVRHIAREDEERISLVILSEEEGGTAARARNAGLKRAKGRYIAFLDADDLWERDKLEKTYSYMVKNEYPFVFTSYAFGDAQARPTGREVRVPAELTFEKALSRTVIFTSTVLIDRESIPEDLIRMPDVESEDTATWWRIMRRGYTAHGLDEVLTVYRRPKGSLSSDKTRAVRRIWRLYRDPEIAGRGVLSSAFNLAGWAARATLRRL